MRLEYFESTGNARVKLVWDAGVRDDWRGAIDSAVSVARRSQVAVVVAGLEEGEFRDRALLSLPGHQEELIERVAATGRPTIVVLVGGGAITMSRWLDGVPAVVDAWYSGEMGGRAVADVLFGDYDPAGRLPTTWPMFEGQLPLYYNHKPTGRGDDYLDLTGQPLFPFGYGLSYTNFEYSGLSIESPEISADWLDDGSMPGHEQRLARGRRGRTALRPRPPRVGRASGDGARRFSTSAPRARRITGGGVHGRPRAASDARPRSPLDRRARHVSPSDRRLVARHSSQRRSGRALTM